MKSEVPVRFIAWRNPARLVVGVRQQSFLYYEEVGAKASEPGNIFMFGKFMKEQILFDINTVKREDIDAIRDSLNHIILTGTDLWR